jgi:hypothetical protein
MSVYHDICIETLGEDGVIVREVTNDDNDDGYSDGQEASWEWRAPSLEKALKRTGKSRIGISGITVTVSVDGEVV